MDFARYLDLLRADADLLETTAKRDLDLAVPTCPGWSVRDVVAHTAEVYQHKLACMRLRRAPQGDYQQQAPEGVDVLTWFRSSLEELVGELLERGPASPSWTWWPPDQTVGFWHRRMAQETAVHRVDVQAAHDDVTPVDDELAVDGIDEILERFLAGDWANVSAEEWRGVDPEAGAGRAIAVRTSDTAWRVTLHRDRVDLERPTNALGPVDATVSGEPSEVLLWLWGRRPLTAVDVEGDRAAIDALRARLVITTQ